MMMVLLMMIPMILYHSSNNRPPPPLYLIVLPKKCHMSNKSHIVFSRIYFPDYHYAELTILRTNREHSGNYTCVASNAQPASVIVHIFKGKGNILENSIEQILQIHSCSLCMYRNAYAAC